LTPNAVAASRARSGFSGKVLSGEIAGRKALVFADLPEGRMVVRMPENGGDPEDGSGCKALRDVERGHLPDHGAFAGRVSRWFCCALLITLFGRLAIAAESNGGPKRLVELMEVRFRDPHRQDRPPARPLRGERKKPRLGEG
jgi:hypothetical protein